MQHKPDKPWSMIPLVRNQHSQFRSCTWYGLDNKFWTIWLKNGKS